MDPTDSDDFVKHYNNTNPVELKFCTWLKGIIIFQVKAYSS